MKVTIEDAGPCRKILHVQAPADEVASGYAEVVEAYTETARVPGFRPGKAPRQVVERRFAGHIKEDARDRLVPRMYRKALEQEDIHPVAIVGVDVVFDKREGLGFDVTVDVAPEFKLPKYRKIVVRQQPVEVGDQRVAGAFEAFLKQFSRYEEVADRSARDGDLLRIDFTARSGETALKELAPREAGLAEGQDFMVMLEEPDFVPGLSKGLIGCARGESRDVTVEFPDDYRVAELAGREAVYTVTVKDIRERVRPEMTEEFLKPFGVDSEAALRGKIRERLVDEETHREQERQREQIARFLLEKTKLDLPRSIVEEETKLTIQGIVQDITRRGATREQIARQQESIVSTATETSTERVKLSYILSRIADAEGIEAAPSEVDARIASMAATTRMTADALRAEMEKRNHLEGLASEIRAGKAMAFLLEHAKLKK